MMNLDEAIKHALRKAIECKGTECGYDHYQLSKWLAELRFYRNLAINFKSFLNLSQSDYHDEVEMHHLAYKEINGNVHDNPELLKHTDQ